MKIKNIFKGRKRAVLKVLAVLAVMATAAGAVMSVRDNAYAASRTYGNNNWDTNRNQENGAPQPKDDFGRAYGSVYNVYYDVGMGSGQQYTTYDNYGYETVLRVDGTWAFVGNNSDGQQAACAPEITLNGLWVGAKVSEVENGENTFALVTFTIHNETDEDKKADLATMADINVGGDDNAPISKIVEKGKENGFKATNIYMEGIDYEDKMSLYYYFRNNNYVKVNATTVWVGMWADRFNCMWDDDLRDVNEPVIHGGTTGAANAVDTGFAASWQGIDVPAYGTAEITYVLGVISAQMKYTVKYDGNGAGSGYVADRSCEYNEVFNIADNGYKRDGYTFTGWNTLPNPTADNPGYSYLPGDEVSDLVPNNGNSITLYAQWERADMFVSYTGNGADNKDDYVVSYAAAADGNTYDYISFTKTGYTPSASWKQTDVYGTELGTVDGGSTIPKIKGETTVRSKVNGFYVVDIDGGSSADGTNIHLWRYNGGSAQQFTFRYAGNCGGKDYWIIGSPVSGKVLDVSEGSGIDGTNAGANVQLWEYNGGDNQLWTLEPAGDGYFYIKSKLDNNLVLDLWGAQADNGTNIAVSEFHGGDNQQWYLWDISVTLRPDWTATSYTVSYDALDGTLLDENGKPAKDSVKSCTYDQTCSFFGAERTYTVSYETNGGTAQIKTENTAAPSVFNGWNEVLTPDTDRGVVKGWNGWCLGEWNWAAYYNANPSLLSDTSGTGNVYDVMYAVCQYREYGKDNGMGFAGDTYFHKDLKFKNLVANSSTVNLTADYTAGSVILPAAEKASGTENGIRTDYVFEGWYSDAGLTKYVGGAGDTYTPDGNKTLYAKYSDTSQRVEFNHKIYVRYENADGTWGEYEQWYSADLSAGDKVYEDFSLLDSSKWVKPATVSYTLEGSYLVHGYVTKVDIKRQTYNVTVKYDNISAFVSSAGEGSYRWGALVTAGASTASDNAQYTYKWSGWRIDSKEQVSLKDGSDLKSNPITFVMPVNDVTLTACSDTETNSYGVKVEHYLMDMADTDGGDGSYPATPQDTDTYADIKYGTVLDYTELSRTYEGFTLDTGLCEEKNGAVSPVVTGETVIKLYYDRNTYKLRVEHYLMDTDGKYPDTPDAADTYDVSYGSEQKLTGIDMYAKSYKGFTFDKKTTLKPYGNDELIVITGDTVIKLYYDRNKYTVKYDYRTNGGTSAGAETLSAYYGAQADLSVWAEKGNWTHMGWNTDENAHAGLNSYTVTGDVTLYAVYKKDITVNFVDFGRTVTESRIIFNKQESTTVDAPVITLYDGFVNVSDVKPVGFNSKKDINAENANVCEIESGEREVEVKDSCTYYAVCQADVTLEYVLNGGTDNDTTKPVKEAVYCNAAAPHEIKGFKLQLGETTKPQNDENGYIHSYTFAIWAENSEDSENIWPANSEYVLMENTVMYALWNETVRAVTYNVVYDGNKGPAVTNVPGGVTVSYDEEFTISEIIPERAGFAFINWNTRADGTGTAFEAGQTAKNLTTVNNATVTLYAQWRQKKPVLVRASSSRYKAVIIKRIPGDDEWYNTFGQLTLDEIGNYPDEQCVQVWHIDNTGTITRTK